MPPDITLLGSGLTALYRSQGHLLEVTDLVEQMQHVPGGLVPASLQDVMSKGKAFGIPQSVSPWSLVTRLDLLAATNVDTPNTWDAFIEVYREAAEATHFTGYGLCLGLATDADHNIMQENNLGVPAGSWSKRTTRPWPCTPRAPSRPSN